MARLSTLAAALALASTALAQNLINTPSLFQCTAAALTYQCAAPPCTVVARPSGDQTQQLWSGGEVADASGSVSWKPVNVAEGTDVTLWITDSNGATVSSASVTVSGGSDDCLSSSGSSGSSSTKAASSATSSAAAVGAAATSAAASGASKAMSAVSSALSGSATTSGAAAPSSSGDSNSAAGSLIIRGSALGAALTIAAVALSV
ncbi:hypothetical protein JCM3775_002717 [Rhodotorula graminis]|uniref:Uncharacterized protein n=1 Tax=Rhodotorula graminis (strain WP1) TaxID=578459 RepID=A0A194S8W2_RHOGW|nr:uncharacterized protein RHOBADRAFT_42226 [Rhodotorula graminis WP1]KPV77014.1 hypothetical protein RHOBADRAFT_42226 [Rhodotorula graminis WP1]